MKFYFFYRNAHHGDPAGVTVSKKPELPDGEFQLTEYVWQSHGYVSLWFIDDDKFTANQRNAAYKAYAGV